MLLRFDSIFVEHYEKKQEFSVLMAKRHKNIYIFSLEGVNDMNVAEDLVGSSVYASNLDIKELKENEFFYHDLVGLTVYSENGDVVGAVDNILMKGKKLIVLDYKTRGYELKEDTHEHYQDQLDIYNFLLRKAGYQTEDYAFLLFYVPKEVLETGEVIFNTTLKKMKINIKNAEKILNSAIKLLNSDCPKKSCEWCDGR